MFCVLAWERSRECSGKGHNKCDMYFILLGKCGFFPPLLLPHLVDVPHGWTPEVGNDGGDDGVARQRLQAKVGE